MLNSNEFSTDYLRKIAYALETDNWDTLGEEFINLEFIGQDGYILLIGPFTRPRSEPRRHQAHRYLWSR